MTWYVVLIVAVGLERLLELVVSKRNAAWAFARGGVEYGQAHYSVMVIVHTLLLFGCVIEGLFRPFIPLLGWSMLAVVGLSQVLRWWCIATLGSRWNTRVIVVPSLPLVRSGPYRYFQHPNYVAVVAEGIALPLVHSAWVTALLFTIVNAWLLTVRIRCEEKALETCSTSS